MPDIVERWQRLHNPSAGQLRIWIIQSRLTCKWVVSGGPLTDIPNAEFDSLVAAQRFADDWVNTLASRHDCYKSNCGSWDLEIFLKGDIPLLNQ